MECEYHYGCCEPADWDIRRLGEDPHDVGFSSRHTQSGTEGNGLESHQQQPRIQPPPHLPAASFPVFILVLMSPVCHTSCLNSNYIFDLCSLPAAESPWQPQHNYRRGRYCSSQAFGRQWQHSRRSSSITSSPQSHMILLAAFGFSMCCFQWSKTTDKD